MIIFFDVAEKPPIDIKELNGYIGQYEKNNGEKPVIFMNYETKIQMRFEIKTTSGERGITLYRGCKVFIDNTLPYGQIELR